jgi:hypothetical protein
MRNTLNELFWNFGKQYEKLTPEEAYTYFSEMYKTSPVYKKYAIYDVSIEILCNMINKNKIDVYISRDHFDFEKSQGTLKDIKPKAIINVPEESKYDVYRTLINDIIERNILYTETQLKKILSRSISITQDIGVGSFFVYDYSLDKFICFIKDDENRRDKIQISSISSFISSCFKYFEVTFPKDYSDIFYADNITFYSSIIMDYHKNIDARKIKPFAYDWQNMLGSMFSMMIGKNIDQQNTVLKSYRNRYIDNNNVLKPIYDDNVSVNISIAKAYQSTFEITPTIISGLEMLIRSEIQSCMFYEMIDNKKVFSMLKFIQRKF